MKKTRKRYLKRKNRRKKTYNYLNFEFDQSYIIKI